MTAARARLALHPALFERGAALGFPDRVTARRNFGRLVDGNAWQLVHYGRASKRGLIGIVGNRNRYEGATEIAIPPAIMAALAHRAGAEVVRYGIYWDDCETAAFGGAGIYNFSAYMDPVFQALSAYGIKMHVVVHGGNKLYGSNWNVPPSTTEGYAAYGAFCAALVTAYPALACVEFGNEPNILSMWKVTPNYTQYAAIAEAGAAAIRAAGNRSMPLYTAGLAPSGTDGIKPADFMAGMMPLLTRYNFTAFGYHPYSGGDTNQATADADFYRPENATARMRAIRPLGYDIKWADTEEGVSVTECAGDTYAARCDRQKHYAARFVLSALMQNHAIWYHLVDRGTDEAEREDNFGLFRYDSAAADFVEKPALYGYRQMIDLVKWSLSHAVYSDGTRYVAVLTGPAGQERIVKWDSLGTATGYPKVSKTSFHIPETPPEGCFFERITYAAAPAYRDTNALVYLATA